MKSVITNLWRLLGIGLLVLDAFRQTGFSFQLSALSISNFSMLAGVGVILFLFPPSEESKPIKAIIDLWKKFKS